MFTRTVSTFVTSLVMAGGLVGVSSLLAQCPTTQTGAPTVPAQVTQRRAYSYEPALVAPRTTAPTYQRYSAPSYSKPIWMTPKTLR